MSYVSHTWVDGETITALKMNNIENGIDEASQSGSGGIIVETVFTEGSSQYDKYFKSTILAQTVLDAYKAGSHIVFHFPATEGYLLFDQWASLVGYEPKDPEDEYSYDTFVLDYNIIKWGSGTAITNDGYIRVNVYID